MDCLKHWNPVEACNSYAFLWYRANMPAPVLHLNKACRRSVAAPSRCRDQIDLFALRRASRAVKRLTPAETVKEEFHTFTRLAPIYWSDEDDAIAFADFRL